jgi:hypothetical protein
VIGKSCFSGREPPLLKSGDVLACRRRQHDLRLTPKTGLGVVSEVSSDLLSSFEQVVDFIDFETCGSIG